MKVKVFVTGGTFDKEYNELTGALIFKDSHLSEMLKLGRSKIDVDIRTLMMIDSLDMQEGDRKIILDHCKKDPSDKILITHGTDTIVETAKFIAADLQDKTVVLTGAMVPYAFGSSDGLFNLGSALAFAQTLPSGVYVAMNGKYYPADNVRKNKQTGFFEEIK